MNILIKNGLFFSGSSAEKPTQKNILIDSEGLIKEIRFINLLPEENLEIIDADGKWIAWICRLSYAL